jgi:hypothetical protein
MGMPVKVVCDLYCEERKLDEKALNKDELKHGRELNKNPHESNGEKLRDYIKYQKGADDLIPRKSWHLWRRCRKPATRVRLIEWTESHPSNFSRKSSKTSKSILENEAKLRDRDVGALDTIIVLRISKFHRGLQYVLQNKSIDR